MVQIRANVNYITCKNKPTRVMALVRSYLFFGKKHIDCLAHFHLLPLTWSLKELNGLCSLQKFTLDGCLPEKNVECDASK